MVKIINLSPVDYVLETNIIAYFVANFMRISKMVLKIFSNVTLMSLWRHKVDIFLSFFVFFKQKLSFMPFLASFGVCLLNKSYPNLCRIFEESDGVMLKTVKWRHFELWRHKYQENCFFYIFHYKIIRLTRLNHSWLVKITPNP